MKKLSFACIFLSGILLGVVGTIVWTESDPEIQNSGKSVESVLAKDSIHVMESLDLTDPRIDDGRLEKGYVYGNNLIVGVVAQRITDITRDGRLVYWNDRDGKLHFSLIRDDKVVTQLEIPKGWIGYDVIPLVNDLRKAISLLS